MKALQILIAGVFIFNGSNAFAQSQNFIKQDWHKAKQEAKATGKFIFLDGYTTWCYWCMVMEKQVFTDSNVAKFMDSHFVLLKMDMEKDTGVLLAQKYCVYSFPTFLIFNPDAQLVYRTSGYEEANSFLNTLKEMIDPSTHFSYPGKANELDPGFPDFYKEVFDEKPEGFEWPDSLNVNSYLSNQTDLFDEVSWAVISRFNNLAPQYNQWILQNADSLKKMYGDRGVASKLFQIADHWIGLAIERNDSILMDSVAVYISKAYPDMAEENLLFYSLTYHEKTANWEGYAVAATKFLKDSVNRIPYFINAISWNIYQNVEDTAAVNAAKVAMQKATRMDPSYNYIDTYAALLYKSGEFKKARQQALLAIEKGQSSGKDVSETEELLKKIEEVLK